MKTIRNTLIMLLIIIGSIELSPYLMAPIVLDGNFSRSGIQHELMHMDSDIPVDNIDEQDEDDADEYLGQHFLHPYIGFVGKPRKSYNRFGFPGPDPICSATDDTINICLLGGSVAMGLWGHSQETLRSSMSQIDAISGKKIKIVLLALAGFKQPQQLMALNYFVAQGSIFDIIINLDGFNEVVLPFTDNLPFKVHPTFPRHWNIYSRKKINSKVQVQLAKQINVNDRRSERKQLFRNVVLSKSNFALLLWKVLENKDNSRLYNIENKIRQALEESGNDLQATGPAMAFVDTISFFSNSVANWRRCSEMMSGLAKTRGSKYFHFLQPNQYVKDSKTFTDFEKINALVDGEFNYKTAVQTGYPLLQVEGHKLSSHGVHFFDLTKMYQSENRSVYDDKCCHFNQLGYDQMAIEISKHISSIY